MNKLVEKRIKEILSGDCEDFWFGVDGLLKARCIYFRITCSSRLPLHTLIIKKGVFATMIAQDAKLTTLYKLRITRDANLNIYNTFRQILDFASERIPVVQCGGKKYIPLSETFTYQNINA